MTSGIVAQLAGWTPAHLGWSASGPLVTWVQLDGEHFTQPFFEQEVAAIMQHPYHQLMRRQTPLEVLGEVAAARPGLTPAGFIFHMSRCGSTVVSQLLATVPRHLVLSEPVTLDFVLQAHLYAPDLPAALQVQWLQWLLGALGQARDPAQRHLFVKFSYWHIFAWPLIRRAFPTVPWIFVYRDPVEVLVSNLHNLSPQFLPGPVGAALLGLDLHAVATMPLDEYIARALGQTCAAVLPHAADGRLVHYHELPDAVWTWLPEYFGVELSAAERAAMRPAGSFDAKDPGVRFHPDGAAKQRAATPLVRELAATWVTPWYDRLEAARVDAAALGSSRDPTVRSL